jgi:hypothetical protein
MMLMAYDHLANDATLFGVPASLTAQEAAALARVLGAMWTNTYGQPVADFADDLGVCHRLFDPVARGSRLRENLAALPPAPPIPPSVRQWLREPLVVPVDHSRRIVGLEARIVLALLAARDLSLAVTWTEQEITEAYQTSTSVYRSWSRQRLDQVIALRTGRAKEVMQAIAVGFVLALLVNRSTAPERALQVADIDRPDDEIDGAVFAAADAFARHISGRNKRSEAQHRLKGGYGATEARRRLGEMLVRDSHGVYVAPGRSGEVVAALANDLARRPRLTPESLAKGLDDLVATYRQSFARMALKSPSHERAADTRALLVQVLDAFERARMGTTSSE